MMTKFPIYALTIAALTVPAHADDPHVGQDVTCSGPLRGNGGTITASDTARFGTDQIWPPVLAACRYYNGCTVRARIAPQLVHGINALPEGMLVKRAIVKVYSVRAGIGKGTARFPLFGPDTQPTQPLR
jgi:hypothetical protein